MTAAAAAQPAFLDAAACRGVDPDLFHPERGASFREAKSVCRSCPVRVECLHWALTTHQSHGIWGGMSERERRRARRQLAMGLPVPELAPADPADPEIVDPEIEEENHVDLVIVEPPPPSPAPTNGKTVADLGDGTCDQCGKVFVKKRRDQRFHTKECARAWYSSHGTRTTTPARNTVAKKTPAQKTKIKPMATTVPAASTSPIPDLHALLGQLLATCDRWAIEADLGDIRISVTRGCP